MIPDATSHSRTCAFWQGERMTDASHPNVRRVVEAAADRGFELIPHAFNETTRTAEDAARAIGVDVGQIVKSLVFVVDGKPVVALVSGSNQLDESKLAAAGSVTAASTTRATAVEVRDATGYPVGGVPPLGHANPLPIFVDRDLLAYDVVWAAAGTPNVNFAVPPHDLVRITGGTVCDLARDAPG
jgi:Cys-tRNA(Pro) deacylase